MTIPDQRVSMRLSAAADDLKFDETNPPKRNIQLNSDDDIDEFVQRAYDCVMQKRNTVKTIILRDYLQKSRDAVLHQRIIPKENIFKRLPTNSTPTPAILATLYCQPCDRKSPVTNTESTTEESNDQKIVLETDIEDGEEEQKQRDNLKMDMQRDPTKRFTVKMRGGGIKSKTWSVSLPSPIQLQGTHPPRPRSSATIFLKRHYATDDEQTLKYVPYFGDDDKEDVVSELYNLEDREKQMEFGSEYQERDTNDIIDETITHMKKELEEIDLGLVRGDSTQSRTELQTRLHESLAQTMDVYLDRIHERYQLLFVKDKKEQQEESSTRADKKSNEITSYLDAVDTYRNLLCRRCFIYDCNAHGSLDKPSLDLQGELAVRKELEGFWDTTRQQGKPQVTNESKENDDISENASGLSPNSKATYNPDAQTKKRMSDDISESLDTTFTPTDKVLCERAFLMFQGDLRKITLVTGVSQTLVEDFVRSSNFMCKEYETVKEDIVNEAKKRKKKKNIDKSMNNYNLAWLKRVEGAVIHPMFIPCDHEGVCSEENCSCIQNAFFCTKHCVWGSKGRNFFRGCACKGRCTTASCSCFAAKRECDPDLCKTCGACTHPPNKPAPHQRCRNDNIGMRRHCHLLLGQSTIEDAGWGIYTKSDLKKGDFVHEYVGEVISQEEAERRGRVYDKVNRSYLFNLTSDFVVDASRKGNKSRFANHSQKPNCCTKMVTVNGDVRIGLYAKEDIEAQSEVSFSWGVVKNCQICLLLIACSNLLHFHACAPISSFLTIAMMLPWIMTSLSSQV